MRPENKDKYIVPFKGAKLDKHEANQIGFGIIAGLIGIVLALILFGRDHEIYSLILIGLFSCVGFFGYGFLKKNKKAKKT